ncbi:DnaJ domain-containing protein [Chthonobacter albigriseus]|uniref:DnaJ domain-containing protein n=1 Tax=Chthonobacter albigriseus TaxID=1683161 RepID=UPI0015EFBBCB|nr:DnaJ domain-containing protein [Chthonobacter albigriseus]
MNWLIIALVGLGAAALALRWFVNTNPGAVLRSGRLLALLIVALLCLALAATGRVAAAILLGLVALTLNAHGMFGRSASKPAKPAGAKGRRSMVRSAALEMELDHATGKMTGRVLAGTYEGRDLDSLGMSSLGRLASEISGDAESRALLEAYLDRRMPRWREHMKADAAAGHRGPANAGAMSEEEAYQILGLEKGAREPEIRAAHRRLMKKVHPDHGGSTFLAARINEAKDRLLSKHR